jgi:hypothetical protein
MRVFPFCLLKLKRLSRVPGYRRHRTVGGIPQMCQPFSQQIVQLNHRLAVEG